MYFQCTEVNKGHVIMWLNLALAKFSKEYPREPMPTIFHPNTPRAQGTHLKTPPPHANPAASLTHVPDSKYQHLMDNPSFASRGSIASKSRRRIPVTITTKAKSYAQVLAALHTDDHSAQATRSDASNDSPLSSTTIKTAREIELEQIVDQLNADNTALTITNENQQSQLTHLQNTFDSLNTHNTALQSNVTDLQTNNANLHTQVAQLQTSFNTMTANMEIIMTQYSKKQTRPTKRKNPSDDRDWKRANIDQRPGRGGRGRSQRQLQRDHSDHAMAQDSESLHSNSSHSLSSDNSPNDHMRDHDQSDDSPSTGATNQAC
jgi:hypothetical protein